MPVSCSTRSVRVLRARRSATIVRLVSQNPPVTPANASTHTSARQVDATSQSYQCWPWNTGWNAAAEYACQRPKASRPAAAAYAACLGTRAVATAATATISMPSQNA